MTYNITVLLIIYNKLPYSWKTWQKVKLADLTVAGEITKLKSVQIYTMCMYVWQYCSRLPNLRATGIQGKLEREQERKRKQKRGNGRRSAM